MTNNRGMPEFSFPPLTPLVRNVLVALVGAFIVEQLIVGFSPLGAGVYHLGWSSFGQGFSAFQPITRYLVQGPNPMGILFGALIIYFFLPILQRLFSLQQLGTILLCGFASSTVLGLTLDLLGLLYPGPAMGWSSLAVAMAPLFGLARPKDIIQLFFVLPLPAAWITWGTGILVTLGFLAAPTLNTVDYLGAWIGAVGWWYLLGPGGKRLRLKARERKIKKELRRFEVIEGGKKDDDWVH